MYEDFTIGLRFPTNVSNMSILGFHEVQIYKLVRSTMLVGRIRHRPWASVDAGFMVAIPTLQTFG